jgi:chaperonin GroES
MRPLYAKIFVEKDPEETIHKTGMIIPDSAKDKAETGTVILAGHGRLLASGEVIPLQVKVGDPIIFAKWAGTEITYQGKKVLLMDEEDVFAYDREKNVLEKKETASE